MEYKDNNIPLRSIQNIELDILIEFDRICRKHGIKYQLFAGTLLGAIRHGGFIPWDDDIDVCLLRDDYDSFLEICKYELDPSFFIQNYITEPSSNYHITKIRKNHTICRTVDTMSANIHEGIFIDVFPMDNVKPNSFEGEFHRTLCFFVFAIIASMTKSMCYIHKNRLKRSIMLISHYITKLIPKNFIHSIADKLIRKYNNKGSEYVCHIANGASKKEFNSFTIKKETFNQLIEWGFEGKKFYIPKDYDYVLTTNYGDYMTPPPLEYQNPHHGIIKLVLDTTIDK